MKRLDRSIGRAVFNRLSQTRGFQDSISFAHQYSVDKPYLVGGRLYRTLVELMFGYTARASCSDFDWATPRALEKKARKEKLFNFATTGQIDFESLNFIKPTRLKDIREKKQSAVEGCMCRTCDEARIGTGGYKYSPRSHKRNTKFGNKFDLIDIGTLPNSRGNSIEDYLEAVPLSIQSIAMDIENYCIFGAEGIKSIREQCVWTNNIEALLGCAVNKGCYPDEYIRDKARHIRFYPCECPHFIAEGHEKPYEMSFKPPKYILQPGTAYVPSAAENIAVAVQTQVQYTWQNTNLFNTEYAQAFQNNEE